MKRDLPNTSREAAQEYSPRRKPWVDMMNNQQAPKGRKKNCDIDAVGDDDLYRLPENHNP